MFNHTNKHFEVRKKYSSTRDLFSTLFLVFGIVVKHDLSFLIYNFLLLFPPGEIVERNISEVEHDSTSVVRIE